MITLMKEQMLPAMLDALAVLDPPPCSPVMCPPNSLRPAVPRFNNHIAFAHPTPPCPATCRSPRVVYACVDSRLGEGTNCEIG